VPSHTERLLLSASPVPARRAVDVCTCGHRESVHRSEEVAAAVGRGRICLSYSIAATGFCECPRFCPVPQPASGASAKIAGNGGCATGEPLCVDCALRNADLMRLAGLRRVTVYRIGVCVVCGSGTHGVAVDVTVAMPEPPRPPPLLLPLPGDQTIPPPDAPPPGVCHSCLAARAIARAMRDAIDDTPVRDQLRAAGRLGVLEERVRHLADLLERGELP
jgi:hypothetical protein